MPHWTEHAKDCREQLGKGWDIIHQWLDEYAGVYWPAKVHRVHRHHRDGVEEIRNKWGNEAAKAAEIHIIKDEGCVPFKEEIYADYGIDINDDVQAKVVNPRFFKIRREE